MHRGLTRVLIALPIAATLALSACGSDSDPATTVPKVTVPNVTAPDVSVPDVTVPDVSVPDVSLPDTVNVPKVSTVS